MQWPPSNPTARHFQKGIPKNRARLSLGSPIQGKGRGIRRIRTISRISLSQFIMDKEPKNQGNQESKRPFHGIIKEKAETSLGIDSKRAQKKSKKSTESACIGRANSLI